MRLHAAACVVLGSCALLAGCGGDRVDLFVASAPADDEFVWTPFGRRVHRSCVHQVPHGAEVDPAGRVTVGGRFHSQITPCPYEPRDVTANGWVEYASAVAPTNPWGFDWFVQFDGHFSVPNAPNVQGGPLIYLFPGLAPLRQDSMLQPVLQYGVGPMGGGDHWTMANWYARSDNTYFVTPLVEVLTGDYIRGGMYVPDTTGCHDDGTNCKWVVFYEMGHHDTGDKYFTVTSPDSYRVAYRGVLAAHGDTRCDQHPASPTVFYSPPPYEPGPTISSIHTVDPSWQAHVNEVTPRCQYGVVNSESSTTLFY